MRGLGGISDRSVLEPLRPPERLASQLDAVGVVQQPVADRVRDRRLAEGLRPVIGKKLDQAWAKEDPDAAERTLRSLADSLEEAHPGAAASVREGLEETLTISRLGLSPALVRTFKSTNPIESLNDGIRVMERNVKNWQSGKMALRWTAAASLEREKRFRRINGYRDMWLLIRALDRHTKEVTSSKTAA